MSRIRRNAALSAVALACAAGSTRADIPYWWYINNSNFGFEIKHMPDFDQRRSASGNTQGLPNNGSMYCVPTATVNLFAYAANHGFPNIGPGMANWQLQSKYNIATATINNVGDVLGGTLAVDGMVDGFGPSLLTGSLDDIGWDDNGGTLLEFLFTVTGGMLAGDYGGNGSQFGVILNLGSGMYTGDWRDSFATTSSSGTADIAPIPGPGALAAFAVAGGLIRRRRRSV